MAYQHEHGHSPSGMSTFGAMLLGMTVGAVGTAVLLAMNERRFHYVVEETKNTAKKVRERLEDGADAARNAAGEAMESAERGASKIKSSLRDNNV